tara:strand:+ start:830 stop:1150 length:321 start_codon:yes stop_codon:yes gene_type:complete
MATWIQERRIEFLETRAEWPITITRNGLSAIGIKTPDAVRSTMMPGNYHTEIRGKFDLLVEDFEMLGLSVGSPRAKFQVDGILYEIIAVSSDTSDATITFDGVQVT